MYRESSGAERWLAKSKERRKNVFEKPLPYNMSLYEERESLKNTSLSLLLWPANVLFDHIKPLCYHVNNQIITS